MIVDKNIMQLANLERSFMQCLLKPDKDSGSFLSELLPLKFIDTEQQLSIYRSNVNGAHQKVLGQIYPACFNILGDDYFNQLCRTYRLEYPSTDADLNNFGEFFSVFIKEQLESQKELVGLEYLTDLAKLEWRWHLCHFAKNDEEFPFQQLQLVKQEQQGNLVFKLNASFSLHTTSYPVLDIWQANKDIIDEKQEFLMPESEVYFCVSRVNFKPKLEILDNNQFKLLSYISKGLSLNDISSLITTDFQQQLMMFIQHKWVVGFRLETGKI